MIGTARIRSDLSAAAVTALIAIAVNKPPRCGDDAADIPRVTWKPLRTPRSGENLKKGSEEGHGSGHAKVSLGA